MGWESQCSWRRQFYFYGLPQLLIHIQLTHILFKIISIKKLPFLVFSFETMLVFPTMLSSLVLLRAQSLIHKFFGTIFVAGSIFYPRANFQDNYRDRFENTFGEKLSLL